jgi:hypothetical protein
MPETFCGSVRVRALPTRQVNRSLSSLAIACRQHAEFVVLGVGKHSPRGFGLILADVGPGRDRGQQ